MFLRRTRVLACVVVLGATAVVPSSVSSLAGLLPDLPAAHNVPVVDQPVKPIVADEATKLAVTGSPEVRWPDSGAVDVEAAVGKRASVEVLDRTATEKAGVRGLMFRVSGDGGRVSVDVDYSSFRHAFGGDWASRLQLVRLPDRSPVPSRNDSATGRLTADVVLPGADDSTHVQSASGGPADGVLLALVANTVSADGQGDYAATPLAPSATWQVSQQTGDFSWSHPLKVPPAPGGLQPQLALGYSSSRVDGRTASTNNQPSWIGEGWDMWSGYIERRFTSCAENTDDVRLKTADKCWFDENASIVLGGQSTQLVHDADSDVWRLKNDDGSKVERLLGASNDDVDGEHWRVTKTDGTQYYFGKDRLDGWTEGKAETNSVWTVPVFGRYAAQPCNKPAFKDSWCQRAWKWNLDYVVDKYGNTMTYYYDRETNHYGRNNNETASSYTRGGTLARIEYGTRKGREYDGAPAQVVFETVERCVPGTACNTADYRDVPFDQKCDGGSCPDHKSPSFWSTKRLSKVITKIDTGAGWQDVDSWSLNHSFPSTEDSSSPALWLTGIVHSGHVGGTVTLPEVTFDGKRLANRVGGAAGFGGYLPLYKFRLTNVYSESGGRIALDYHDADCERNSRLPNKSALDANVLRCFPVTWAPPNRNEDVDWFHKYVVRAVVETDRTGGAPDQKINYTYMGDPAWHYTDDEITPERLRTWSEWRGYARVKVTKGSSQTERLFYRGMNGDRAVGGGTRPPVILKDSKDNEFLDIPAAQGFQREQIARDGPDGAALVTTITKPEPLGPFAKRGALEAWMVRPGETRTYTALAAGSERTTTSTSTYNSDGVVTRVDDRGDDATNDDDLCVNNSYVNRDDLWIRNVLIGTETSGKACGMPVLKSDVVKKTRTYYDDSLTHGAVPGLGNATKVEQAVRLDNGEFVYEQASRAAFDAYGRVTESYDGLDRKSTTTYTHTAGLLTEQTVTNPKGFTAKVRLHPAWGQPTEKTDANGGVARLEYDALGRLHRVYQPGRTNDDGPNVLFEYFLRKDAVTAVSTTTVGDANNDIVSWALYDGLLRPRQTQSQSPYVGRLITDTFYNDRGLVERTASAYYNQDSEPKGILVAPPAGNEVALPAQTVNAYDALGRSVSQKFIGRGTEKWTSSTSYGGDRVAVTPPPGGTATTTLTDARGRTVELRQHKAATPTGEYDATRYTYSKAGELQTVKDPAGNTWRSIYDLRGRKTAFDDPDRGRTESVYDAAGQLTSTTDSSHKTLTYSYDVLGRKEAVRNGTTTLAEWTYDTVAKGLQTASIRYSGGHAYKNEVVAYDPVGRPLTTRVVIPSVEGALAGTYESKTRYGDDGSPKAVDLPAAGDLPAEQLRYEYLRTGQPDYLKGATTYVVAERTKYNEYGQLSTLHLDTGLAKGTKWVQFNYTYEMDTRRLSTANVLRGGTSGQPASKTRYNYDAVGNIRSVIEAPTSFNTDGNGNITELPNNQPSSVDYQCFNYDHLRQLTEAWAGTGKCAAEPSLSAVGGPAGYWQSFRYDKAGNRTSETEHAAAGDTVSTYHYPQGGHLLRSVTSEGPTGQQLSEFDYDSTGNMTRRMVSGTTHTMEWDAEGHLASDTAAGQSTSFLYDADGNRLLRKAPGATTLYLGSQELMLISGATTARGTRYYSLGGQTIAVRTKAGLSWLFSDHQGTKQLSIAVTTGLEVTQRRQSPFGEARGVASGAWPDEKGFVGGTVDASTGLTHLGAREYDASTGRFVSADPLMDLSDPQQWNGYAYGNSSPVTFSDPSGLLPVSCLDDGSNCSAHHHNDRPAPEAYWGMLAQSRQQDQALEAANISKEDYRKAQELEKQSWVDVALQAGGEVLKEILGINDMAKCFGEGDFGACASMVLGALPWGKILKAGKIVEALHGAVKAVRSFLKQQEWARGLMARARDALSRGGCNSFTPETQVLMADGSRKPLARVRVGDQVLATDPETGESGARTVANVIIGWGKKHLVEITVDTDGADGSAAGTVTATDGHPFWLPDPGRWVKADELQAGSMLQTSAGAQVQVTAVREWTARQLVYNLTVTDIHTYYVVAGGQTLLNHNSNSDDVCKITLGPSLDQKNAGVTAERGDRVLPHEQKMLNEFGDEHGCWSCPAKESGYKDGHWTGDHNPPHKLAPEGPWTLYPQCKACTLRQGGTVNGLNRGWYDRFDNE